MPIGQNKSEQILNGTGTHHPTRNNKGEQFLNGPASSFQPEADNLSTPVQPQRIVFAYFTFF